MRLFLCFPDPHFKARKHKARIISPTLMAEYAYVMRERGWLYFITDVEDLYRWARRSFDTAQARQLWVEVDEREREADVGVRVMRDCTEEGRKVGRNGGEKFVAVWQRKGLVPWPGEEAER